MLHLLRFKRDTAQHAFRRATPLALVGIMSLAACGGSDSAPPATDAAPTIDAPLPDGWNELIGRDWSLSPGSGDVYRCVRIRLDRDTHIAGFRSIAPLGSHHAVLTLANGGMEGEYDCGASSLDAEMLYASGVGTDDFIFPDGVAVTVPAGSLINLNLHLFNASDAALSGHSGIAIREVAQSDVQQTADFFFAGTFALSIPGGGQTTNALGGCTANRDYQVFALWPHMHQYGVHQKVEHLRGGNATVLHDAPYAFSEQDFFPRTPEFTVEAGDQLRVTCTYTNESPNVINFGDSSEDEMCFTGFYRYPAGGFLFECVSQ